MERNEPRKLGEAEVRALVERTLSLYPILNEVYDEDFISDLVHRRVSPTNHLLFVLSQPEHDASVQFWTSTASDLNCLLEDGSLAHFRHDLRKEEAHDLQVVRSELAIAAWMKRRGFSIVLEPLTNDGSRCEFRAGTAPPTWWEIKTPRDVGKLAQPELSEDGKEKRIINLRKDQDIDTEVRFLLNEIRQPYIIDCGFNADFARENVAAVVKEIKKQLLAHHQAGGKPGATFEHCGLRVIIVDIAKSGVGGVGATSDRGYTLERENMEMIQELIRNAAKQLPVDEAGIVVIDASVANYMDLQDMSDACYGELIDVCRNGEVLRKFRSDGSFKADMRTHVSAVVFYEHILGNWGRKFRYYAFHNPFAAKPLPKSLFNVKDAKQVWSGREFVEAQ